MPEIWPIHIPQEYVNDDTVKLLRWLVEEGQEVNENVIIAEFETSKAVVELAAGASGRINQRTKAGDEVRVGEIIGYIAQNGVSGKSTASGIAPQCASTAASTTPNDADLFETRFSKKALELLKANDLSSSVFAGRGLVREQDIAAHLERLRPEHAPPVQTYFGMEGISLEHISFPAAWNERKLGTVDGEFLKILNKSPDEFAKLSSAEKCATYRKHGAFIGEGVVLSPGTILISPQIVIGDRVQIGAGGYVHCREKFAAGQLTSFRDGLSVRGGTVVLGENVFGGTRVQIGGGGHGDPYAVLSIGDGTFVGDDVFINVCRPVLIGKEVFLTQRSILVTHNIGHSVLEGYENRFAPIVLEDYAQVGMNSTIYAGSRIGQGSIVMSNSYVVSSVPPGKLAAGVPARVLREATRPLDRTRQIEIVETMIREYHTLLVRKGYAVSALQNIAQVGFELQSNDNLFRLSFVEQFAARERDRDKQLTEEDIFWTFEDSCEEQPRGCTVMDLLAKKISGKGGVFAETTREFLRKRGIRLEPGPWRYAGGLI